MNLGFEADQRQTVNLVDTLTRFDTISAGFIFLDYGPAQFCSGLGRA